MIAPKPVSVHVWGELPSESRIPRVLRVFVDGEAAGAITYDPDEPGLNGPWIAQSGGLRPSQPTSHATAVEALRKVLRSGWARELGARAASDLHWSGKARRLIDQAARRTGGAR